MFCYLKLNYAKVTLFEQSCYVSKPYIFVIFNYLMLDKYVSIPVIQ